MALILQAPFTAITAAIALPNPELNDTEFKDQSVTVKRTMKGGTYTYTKTTNNTTFNFLVKMTRNKSLELRDFILDNHQKEMLVTMEWRNETWKLRLINNPVEILTQSADYNCFAEVDVQLQFEGSKI